MENIRQALHGFGKGKRRKMGKKHIVFDCDCTFGVPKCDVDDGLALMYLLGCEDAEILGVTATYGNNCLPVVWEALGKLLRDLGREDIPVKRGGDKRGASESEGSRFLVEMADRYPGELSILATGSLTNLWGAYETDSTFFGKVKEIVLMGGITSPLVFEKKVMNELNFSCDPHASWTVLTKGSHVSVVSANNCLKVLFTREEYKERFFGTKNPAFRYIREKTDYWFGYNEEDYGIQGFYNWDVTAAVYLMHPELFTDVKNKFRVTEEDLQIGFLRLEQPGNCTLNLPEIGQEAAFKNNIYETWMKSMR